MNDKQKTFIELMLTLLAVIAGSIAASGAFVSASYERQRVALEQKPTIFLACEPEFRALDTAERIKPETNAAFLTNRGARWIHIADFELDQTPAPFARCTLSNYGRLPVLNLRLGLSVRGSKTSLDVPGLASSDRYSFSLINGTSAYVRFSFEPIVTLTRVDTGSQDSVPLYLSQALVRMQERPVEPSGTR